jgi:hypothetical protein
VGIRLQTPNLVSRPEIRRWVQHEWAPRLCKIRHNRRPFDLKIQGYDKIYRAILDHQSYQGRHKAYMPALRKMTQSYQHQLRAGSFPLSDWHSVEAIENTIEEDRARAMHDLQRHFFETTLRLKAQFEPFSLQYLVRGTAPIKIIWEDTERTIRRLVRKEGRKPGKARAKIVKEVVKSCYGPTWRNVSLYSWYVYPETVDFLPQAELVFEDKECTVADVKAMAAKWLDDEDHSLGHLYEGITPIIDRPSIPPEFKEQRKQRFRELGMVDPLDPSMPAERCVTTLAYWRGEIPGASHIDEETGKEVSTGETDWLIELGDFYYPLRIQQNPFWYGGTPYIAGRFAREVDEFYGHSLYEGPDRIGYILNDVVNQMLDGYSLAASPIAKIDPSAHSRPGSLRLLPGAKWLIRPDAAIFDRPPDVTQTGVFTASYLQGAIHDFGALGPVAQGQSAVRGRGRGGNTAAGLGMISQASSMEVQTSLENLGTEVYEPLMQLTAQYIDQFMVDPIVLRILGEGGVNFVERRLAAQDVIGRYVFRWNGATATREKQSITAQMERLMPLLMPLAMNPQAAQAAGVAPQMGYILRRLWSDGLGLSGARDAFPTPDDLKSIDPAWENELLLNDRPVKVHPGDDDMQHLATQYPLLRDARVTNDPERIAAVIEHLQAHEAQAQAKAQAMQQQQMMQQQMALQGGGGQAGGPPGMPQASRPQSMPSGVGGAPEMMADEMRGQQQGPTI